MEWLKRFFGLGNSPRPTDAVKSVNKMNIIKMGEDGNMQIAEASSCIDMAIEKVNAGMVTADSNIDAIEGVMSIMASKLAAEKASKASLEVKLAELHVVKTSLEDM